MATTDLTIDAGALTAAIQALPARRMFLVVHVEGSDPPSWVVELPEGGEITFGRSRGATIVVDHEKVSRVHARIRRHGDRLDVEDLDSRNGTRVNSDKVEGVRTLAPGDEIAVGPATVVVGVASHIARRTRVADVDTFEARLAAELDHANRYRHRIALAALQVTGNDAVVEALARSIRGMDLVGDYGGDQFALLLPRLGHDEASAALRRMIDEARLLRADVRAGIAIAPEHGRSGDELLARARAALRQARTPGALVVAADAAAPVTGELVIAAPAMRRIYTLIDRIADSMLSVLILGETGVGKEVVAEAIHARSSRRAGPLVKINCASIPDNLLESELFGHERGAFTGADRRKIGFFEAASGGTIFLDEIGEMAQALQAKMLRVLERKVITRVGGTEEVAVDVRVVAATHRDVEAEVRGGRFREDLYFRLAGFTLAVPPLRDRVEETVPLAEHFVRRVSEELGQPPPVLSEDAQLALRSHDWPGNVRELRNAIERAVVVASGGTISGDDLPDRVADAGRRARPPLPEGSMRDQLRDQLADLERTAIVETLEHFHGNQTRTAQKLGISRRALIYKMERLGLKPPPTTKA